VFKKDAPPEQTIENSPETYATRLGIKSGAIVVPNKNQNGAVLIHSILVSNYGLNVTQYPPGTGPDDYKGAITDSETLFTYGNETANLLDAIKNPKGKKVGRTIYHGITYGDSQNSDPDTGQAVENCMRTKLGLPTRS
jgi:hypothetical protein